MTHHRIWKFRPSQGFEQEFAAAYNGEGAWATLFAKANGYCGTSLLKPVEPGGWWLTIDRWGSLRDFELFRQEFGVEYRALDDALEGIAGEEEYVGAFEGDS
jgi:hypothetical protein